jgi:hypothetical protein
MSMGGKSGQLLLQLRGMTLGALGLLLAKDNGFEGVATFNTNILKNRHDNS